MIREFLDVLGTLKPFVELGAVAVIALGLLSIVARTVERGIRHAATEAAEWRREAAGWRREAAESAERLAVVLDNHLGELTVNQARTAVALDLIVSRLLDAGLRTVGSGEEKDA